MTGCVIVGSGNIGTDLLYKLARSKVLSVKAMVGIDPDSEGLRRARDLGVETSTDGIDWVADNAAEFKVVFEATSAAVHRSNAPRYAALGLVAVDLTPAKVGCAVVPGVNLDANLDALNVNLITCGGQATTPIVAAVSQSAAVPYAEIISTVASVSAGPGTRANIDEFTRTTSSCLVEVGGASVGKAIMILNPADPPILMRNTVYCGLAEDYDETAIATAIATAVTEIRHYVPGYRLVADPVFEVGPFSTPAGVVPTRVITLLEVSGAGDFLPDYAGNLDIMTSAAVRVGEAIAVHRSAVTHG